MTADLILDLTVEWISLYRRGPHVWQRLARFRSDDPDLTEALMALTRAAPDARRAIVIVPPEQVAFAAFTEEESPSSANELLKILEGKTPFPAETLRLDWRRAGPGIQIAAIPVAVITEAEAFTRAHGLECEGIVARPEPDKFSGSPWFGVSDDPAPNGMAAQAGGRDVIDVSSKSVPQHAKISDATERRISDARQRARILAEVVPAVPHPPYFDDLDDAQSAAPEPEPRARTEALRRAVLSVFGRRSGRLAAVALTLCVLGLIGWAWLRAPLPDPVPAAPSEIALAEPSMSAPKIGAVALPEAEVSTGTLTVVPETGATGSFGGRLPVAGSGTDAQVPDATQSIRSADPDAEPVSEIKTSADFPDEATDRASFYTPSPGILNLPAVLALDEFTQPALDPSFRVDALALPDPILPPQVLELAELPSPPAPEKRYPVDALGLIVPKAGGQETPEGYQIYAGAPKRVPTSRPELVAEAEPEVAIVVITNRNRLDADDPLRRLSPQSRPDGLAEVFERNALGGKTTGELSTLRPVARPPHVVAAIPVVTPAPPVAMPDGSLAGLPRPESRPASPLNAVVAVPATKAAPTQKTAVVPDAAPAKSDTKSFAAAPKAAKASKTAPRGNQIDLSEVNLLGTFGARSNMRALVRLANGNVLKVKVGDKVDGGRVSSIDRNELTYEKRGKQQVLRMPGG